MGLDAVLAVLQHPIRQVRKYFKTKMKQLCNYISITCSYCTGDLRIGNINAFHLFGNPGQFSVVQTSQPSCSVKISFFRKLGLYANLPGKVDPSRGEGSIKLGTSAFLDVECLVSWAWIVGCTTSGQVQTIIRTKSTPCWHGGVGVWAALATAVHWISWLTFRAEGCW